MKIGDPSALHMNFSTGQGALVGAMYLHSRMRASIPPYAPEEVMVMPNINRLRTDEGMWHGVVICFSLNNRARRKNHEVRRSAIDTANRKILAGLLLLALTTSARADETVTYYYTNQQGTPLATADAAGNVLRLVDYKPYGSQALGSQSPGPGYTGHVSDPDSGLIYMQARFYDPLIGRFVSTDPVVPKAGDLFGFNRLAYTNNNPVGNIDSDGRVVTSLNAANNAALANAINQYARGTYAFSNNNLERVGGGKEGTSSYYAEKIDALIASPQTGVLDIAPTYTAPDGSVVGIDAYGGGVTQKRPDGRVFSTISGKDSEGSVAATPAQILFHEIVGHMAPLILGRDSGNAVTNENKVRAETGLPQRSADPTHVETGEPSPPPSNQCGVLCSH